MSSEDYSVDYAEITRVYRTLRGDVLVDIPHDFYRKAAEYIASLEKAEEEAGPSNRELLHTARTQIREARKLLNQIWEFRTRKLALFAVSQRRAETSVQKGLSDEEQEFLSRMVSVVREHENASLRTGRPAGDTPPAIQPSRVPSRVPTNPEVRKAEGPGEDAQKDLPFTAPKLVMVRFVENVPKFATEFGEFDVKKEDVAFLPEAYSRVLVERKVAVRIGGN